MVDGGCWAGGSVPVGKYKDLLCHFLFSGVSYPKKEPKNITNHKILFGPHIILSGE